jgi:hypothetical protein
MSVTAADARDSARRKIDTARAANNFPELTFNLDDIYISPGLLFSTHGKITALELSSA